MKTHESGPAGREVLEPPYGPTAPKAGYGVPRSAGGGQWGGEQVCEPHEPESLPLGSAKTTMRLALGRFSP